MGLQLKSSQYAAEQINQARANAEARPNSAHAAKWRALNKLLLEVVADEEHAFSPATALGRRGPVNLSGVRRAKLGRERVFFLASRQKQLAIVLMLGFRKEGIAPTPTSRSSAASAVASSTSSSAKSASPSQTCEDHRLVGRWWTCAFPLVSSGSAPAQAPGCSREIAQCS